jgi:hypothetical protein
MTIFYCFSVHCFLWGGIIFQGPTYMIGGTTATSISLSGNCFFQNDFDGMGLVSVPTKESIHNVTNNFGSKDDDGLACDFIAVEDGDCIDFDLNKCPVPGVDAPPVQTKSSSGRMVDLTAATTVLVLALGICFL